MSQKADKSSDMEEGEIILKGKIIKEHLENVNMDAWFWLFKV